MHFLIVAALVLFAPSTAIVSLLLNRQRKLEKEAGTTILSLLAGSEKEIETRQITAACAGMVRANIVNIILEELERKGLVTSRIGENDDLSGRPRRLWKITKDGMITARSHWR